MVYITFNLAENIYTKLKRKKELESIYVLFCSFLPGRGTADNSIVL